MTAHLWGLPTLEPTEKTIGAALSVGVKPKGGGWPIEKDRFHVVEARTREREEKGRDGKPRKVEYRPHDPRFAAYNGSDLDTRRVMYGMLCYHLEEECWHPNYGMYRAPKGRGLINPTSKRFSCTGNGKQAERWMGEAAEVIPCPGEGCPFRQGDSPPCMPRARFWFIPVWKPEQGKMVARYKPDGSIEQLLPRPIMRLATQGREARDTFAGMLQDVRRQVENDVVGIAIRSWFGLTFSITLSEGTNPDKKTRWPDITFALDGDWMAWAQWQSGQFRALAEAAPVLALGSASEVELDPETVGAEHLAIVPTVTKPVAVAVPSEDVIDADVTGGAAVDTGDEQPDEVAASPVSEDPRGIRQMIEEDYVAGAGLSPKKIGPALFKAGLKERGKQIPDDADRADVRKALDALVKP